MSYDSGQDQGGGLLFKEGRKLKMSMKLQGKKVVGVKQTIKIIKNGKARIVYIASDADKRVTEPIEDLCRQNNIEIIFINTMAELGHMCGIDVGAATAALINE